MGINFYLQMPQIFLNVVTGLVPLKTKMSGQTLKYNHFESLEMESSCTKKRIKKDKLCIYNLIF